VRLLHVAEVDDEVDHPERVGVAEANPHRPAERRAPLTP
jgi:hypothetical protein